MHYFYKWLHSWECNSQISLRNEVNFKLKFETSEGPNVSLSLLGTHLLNGFPDMGKGQAGPDGVFAIWKVSSSPLIRVQK